MSSEAPIESWFRYLSEGIFKIQKSASTGKYIFYPRMFTPGDGIDDLEWVEPCGFGTVYSTTVVRQRPPNLDYNLAIVELDEGPRLMSRVEGLPAAEVKIGMRVKARIAQPAEGGAILLFDVAAAQ